MYLTLAEASRIFTSATLDTIHHNMRLGQAIMVKLPFDVYKAVTNTDLDIFYMNDEKAADVFWTNYVTFDNLPSKLQLREDMETKSDD